MANTFKNAGAAILASSTEIYECPAGTTAVVNAIYLSNIDGTNNATVDVTVYDDSGATTFHILKGSVLPAGQTLVFDKPVVLDAADKISAVAGAAGDVEAMLSILQIT